ncbi:hypothetical protein [Sandaracinus amylolyticus]|uniref:Uncharacterized protein n=1 Tax=Sandaracinus amylolyticus TaxID=927083 RepID=A0A0F6W2E4_9BACT|nr:hypothetical protein [Sandaracinus amylolyticus]AKF05515.1 hypothetical protein DB32_002664 [Sandaracinus amylolyticus]
MQTTAVEGAPEIVLEAVSDVLWSTAAAGAIFCLVVPVVAATAALRLHARTSVHLVASAGVAIASVGTGVLLLHQVSGVIHGVEVLVSTAPDRRALAFAEEVRPTSSLPLLTLWAAALVAVLAAVAVARRAPSTAGA